MIQPLIRHALPLVLFGAPLFAQGTALSLEQFTEFAILMLEKEGKLALDDDVRKHITELPDLGHTVTIRHLLTHTSGYREFLNTLGMSGRRLDEGDYIDRQEVIDVILRQPKLRDEPGEFSVDGSTRIVFDLEEDGAAIGFMVSESRTTGVVFKRF